MDEFVLALIVGCILVGAVVLLSISSIFAPEIDEQKNIEKLAENYGLHEIRNKGIHEQYELFSLTGDTFMFLEYHTSNPKDIQMKITMRIVYSEGTFSMDLFEHIPL